MPRPLPLALALLLAGASLAAAEHRPYYRFIVLGYVTDAAGHPVADREVELVRDKTGFSYLDRTNARGFYVIVARLGDEDLGERLTLRLGGATVAITARFDPADHVDERGTRVDLVAGRPVERAAWFPSTLRAFLGRR